MADVWYLGTFLAGGDVQLDEHEHDWPNDLRVTPADIASAHPAPGQSVEVFWPRGDAGEWHRGKMLERGRVEFDKPALFVDYGPFILQPEEFAEVRPASG